MSLLSSLPFRVGKFLITPLSRKESGDQFTASLSVRSGQGSQSLDKVYKFKPTFASPEGALMYAAAQGRYWLINPQSLA